MTNQNNQTVIYTWKNKEVTYVTYYESQKDIYITVDWIYTIKNLLRDPKNSILTNPYLKKSYLTLRVALSNLLGLCTLATKYIQYKKHILQILNGKEIILNIQHGGLGDWLVYSKIPELLYKKFSVKTYISKSSYSNLRNKEIYSLIFEKNPFCYGLKDVESQNNIYTFSHFPHEKNILTLLTDKRQKDWSSIISRQLHIDESDSTPKVYVSPKHLEEYRDAILVDLNFISGKKLGWYYNQEKINKIIDDCKKKYNTSKVVYVNPSDQDIHTYYGMINSCACFVTILSGGAALAATIDKEFIVILPENISGGSVDGFVFTDSKGRYIR